MNDSGAMRGATPPQWLLPAILAVAAVLRGLAYQGSAGADDLFVAAHAQELLSFGPSMPLTHYAMRVGLVYPLAGVFALFGVGGWQLAVLPMLFSLLGIWLAWRLGQELAGPWVGAAAALLLALFPLDVNYATLYFPDLIEGAALALAVYWAVTAARRVWPLAWQLLAGLAWGFAYLVKEEAGLLLLVWPLLVFAKRLGWRQAAWVVVGFGLVWGAETTLSYQVTGLWMPRLQLLKETVTGAVIRDAALARGYAAGTPRQAAPAAAATAPKPEAVHVKTVEAAAEYGAHGLGVLPKAWFITFYEVGLYYYLLVAALGWVVWRRRWQALWLVGWVGLFLLWMEFGGNPFQRGGYNRTHLVRYCAVVNVPLAVLLGLFVTEGMAAANRRWVAVVLVASSLFFINFNTLNWERQVATQRAMERVAAEGWFPLYTDAGSLAQARFSLVSRGVEQPVFSLQRLVGQGQATEITQVGGEKTAYVLLNQDTMRYVEKRYGVARVEQAHLGERVEPVLVVSNPMGGLAYRQAAWLVGLARWLPSAALRDKIGGTGANLLEGDEVVVYRISGRADAGGRR